MALRVHIYDLQPAVSRVDLYESITPLDKRWQYSIELSFLRLLRTSAAATLVPASEADLFYVPAMTMLGYLKLRGVKGAVKTWMSQLEATLRKAGPYWDMRRSRHILWSLRCGLPKPGSRRRHAERNWLQGGDWPSVWDSGATLLCLEPASEFEMGVGIPMPWPASYCGAAAAYEEPAASLAGNTGVTARGPAAETTNRSALLVFSGSEWRGNRRKWLQSMRHSATCKSRSCTIGFVRHVARDDERRDGRSSQQGPPAAATGAASAIEPPGSLLYRSGQFTLCPRGDTSSRKALFDAMACNRHVTACNRHVTAM